MSLKLPFFAQEHPDTCALACLRMILAFLGTTVTEAQLVQAAQLEAGGVNPDELTRLAQHFGLKAEARQLDLGGIDDLLAQQQFPLVFVYRLPLDRVPSGHAVVVTRVSAQFVTCLDPLRGVRRISKKKFAEAQRLMDHWVVACQKE
jgi:ABC-type bacteriocin/lantibiotic exporter with double-glycine peptidase domain